MSVAIRQHTSAYVSIRVVACESSKTTIQSLGAVCVSVDILKRGTQYDVIEYHAQHDVVE